MPANPSAATGRLGDLNRTEGQATPGNNRIVSRGTAVPRYPRASVVQAGTHATSAAAFAGLTERTSRVGYLRSSPGPLACAFGLGLVRGGPTSVWPGRLWQRFRSGDYAER
jgi:hypothetical protein